MSTLFLSFRLVIKGHVVHPQLANLSSLVVYRLSIPQHAVTNMDNKTSGYFTYGPTSPIIHQLQLMVKPLRRSFWQRSIERERLGTVKVKPQQPVRCTIDSLAQSHVSWVHVVMKDTNSVDLDKNLSQPIQTPYGYPGGFFLGSGCTL